MRMPQIYMGVDHTPRDKYHTSIYEFCQLHLQGKLEGIRHRVLVVRLVGGTTDNKQATHTHTHSQCLFNKHTT